MKIELKNIKVYERMSEETTAFNADIWVNGAKIGYAENRGCGGATSYHSYTIEQISVIKEAEAFCLGKEPITESASGIIYNLPMTLEVLIDLEIGKYLDKKEKEKFLKKMEKAMLNGFVVGNADHFRVFKLTHPISGIPKEKIQVLLQQLQPKIKQGERILNTNI